MRERERERERRGHMCRPNYSSTRLVPVKSQLRGVGAVCSYCVDWIEYLIAIPPYNSGLQLHPVC